MKTKSFDWVRAITYIVTLTFCLVWLIGVIGLITGAIGCSEDGHCDNPGDTKCVDAGVWVCSTDHIWSVEQKCTTVTTLDGKTLPGKCCINAEYAYCAIDCEVSDADPE